MLRVIEEIDGAQALLHQTDLVLHFDGACESVGNGPRNPGGLGTYGWVITDFHENEIAYGYGVVTLNHSLPVPKGMICSTNNRAEYCALGFALRYLSDKKWRGSLNIRGDSQLVINQLTEEWDCNASHLRKLRARCLELAAVWPWSAMWVERLDNRRADQLSQRAYTEHTGLPFPITTKKGKR